MAASVYVPPLISASMSAIARAFFSAELWPLLLVFIHFSFGYAGPKPAPGVEKTAEGQSPCAFRLTPCTLRMAPE
jgi:hypothetical protein